jgi:hypothetical protein
VAAAGSTATVDFHPAVAMAAARHAIMDGAEA